jgi:hypothetical protein
MPNCYRATLALLLPLFALAAGCQQSAPAVDPHILAELRSRFVLAAEPDGVEGVLDVQESYEAPRNVVLVGQIGGVADPWTAGKASFVIADPVTMAEMAESGAEHECTDPGCKFCANQKLDKMKEGVAIVRFVNPDGAVVPIDARELFSLQTQETVVVQGRVEVDGLGCLVVLADGLYVRR